MTDLALHPKTELAVTEIIASPPQALLISGPNGVGKSAVAKYLIQKIIDLSVGDIDSYRFGMIISPAKGSISIDQIRSLNEFLSLKTTGQGKVRRFVVIEHADTMTIEAQNSLLKLLEEPPRDSVIFLTAAQRLVLLPTVLSRLQLLAIELPPLEALQSVFKLQGAEFDRLYRLSGGLPGLLADMLGSKDSQKNPLLLAVEQARLILKSTTFERLSLIDKITRSEYGANAVVEMLVRMSAAAIEQAAAADNSRSVSRWQKVMASAYLAQNKLSRGANQKLALSELMINL
jgi:DNA polymerase-3 subunit delta'